MSVLPDPGTSRAVLIGTSRYDHLEQLPAVANNLTALAGVLTGRLSLSMPTRHLTVVANPRDPSAVMDPLRQAAAEATDTLIVYYAGHGLIDPQDTLALAMPHTKPDRIETSLNYNWLRQILLSSRAQRHVVLLDCCYSGLALGRMSAPRGLADHAAVEGTFLLAASAETRTALAPVGDSHTAFTGALLDILSHGIPGGPPLLDLETVYHHLRLTLEARGHPVPQARNRNSGARLALARNNAEFPTSTACAAADPSSPTQVASDLTRLNYRLVHNPSNSQSGYGHHAFMVFSPDGSVIADCSQGPLESAYITLRDPRTGKEIRRLAQNSKKARTLAFSPDGSTLALGSLNGVIYLWDLATNTLRSQMTGDAKAITSLAFSPDGRSLAAAGAHKCSLRVWDAATGQERFTPRKLPDYVNAVAYSPDGKALAVGGEGSLIPYTGQVHIRDARSGRLRRRLTLTDSAVDAVTFSPDGRSLAAGGKSLHLWNAHTGRQHREFAGHTKSVSSLAFSPDGRVLAAGDGSGAVVLRNGHTGEQLLVLQPAASPGDSEAVRALAFSPDGGRLAVGHVSGAIRIWATW
ncbi:MULTISPECIES: caspase family protein [unclassified Streptomyces]|uniref:caspase, EACC1-associated type n=1 Tax=unclassified Streptomyces TaxID=2593676 RepID=UPI0035E03D44